MKKYIYLSLAAISILALLLFGTDPRNVSSVTLVAPFVLIFLILFFIFSYFLKMRRFNIKASWIIATFIALLPTLLLVLQSIGQLTARDVATIMALFAIAYFYASRIDNPANK
jgi:hypothetical protein